MKKGEMEKKRSKIIKGKVEIEMEGGKSSKWGDDFFFFFCFSLFKMTKICFGSTKIEIFYREKAFLPGKKSEKMTLPPQKIFLLRPCPKATIY